MRIPELSGHNHRLGKFLFCIITLFEHLRMLMSDCRAYVYFAIGFTMRQRHFETFWPACFLAQ